MPLKQTTLFSFDEPVQQSANAAQLHDDGLDSGAEIITEHVEVTFDAPPAIKENPQREKSTRGRKKLSEVGIYADLIDVPEDAVLFEKKYYSIGIVADMFKVKISLIRFWENEFDILKPKKNAKGDRHFRPEDVVNLKLIHHLLREKKYTIEGARDFLKKNKKSDDVFSVIEELKRMKAFLTELKVNL